MSDRHDRPFTARWARSGHAEVAIVGLGIGAVRAATRMIWMPTLRVSARRLQGMARVRSGQAPAWPLT